MADIGIRSISLQLYDLLTSGPYNIIQKSITFAATTSLASGRILKRNQVKATGTVTFTFSSATLGDELPAGTIIAAQDGTLFATDTLWTAPAGGETTIDRTVTALQPGTAGNQGIGLLSNLASVVPDLTISAVTNAAATENGTDEVNNVTTWDGDDDTLEEIFGVLLMPIDDAAAGTYIIQLVTEGTLNLDRVDFTTAIVGTRYSEEQIIQHMESLNIFMAGADR